MGADSAILPQTEKEIVMYPVDLHMHTVASTHAYSTLHDYIAKQSAKGIKLFAITDHGPDMAMRRTTGILLICVSGRGWWMALASCEVSSQYQKYPGRNRLYRPDAELAGPDYRWLS